MKNLNNSRVDNSKEYIAEIYQSGTYKYGQRDFKGANADFTKVIKLDNSLADAFYRRGRSNYELRQYNEALMDFTEAKRLNKSKMHDEGYYYMGLVNKALGFLDQAIDCFTNALKLRGDYIDALYERGVAYSKQKKYAEAIDDYSESIQMKPGNYIIYERRADSEMKIGRIKEAIKDYTVLIEKCNSLFSGEYIYNRGMAYFGLRKYARAIVDFNKAAELYKPCSCSYSDRDIFLHRGIAKYNLKNYAEATNDFAKVINTFSYFSSVSLKENFPDIDRPCT